MMHRMMSGEHPFAHSWRRLQLAYRHFRLNWRKTKVRHVPSPCRLTTAVLITFVCLLAHFRPNGPGDGNGFREPQSFALEASPPHRFLVRREGTQYTPPCCKDAVFVLGADNEHEIADAIKDKSRRDRQLRVGFVTYATGPYNAFVEELWASLQRLAFTRHEVHLFAFTDQAFNTSFLPHPRVHRKQQDRLGWPFDSLARHFLFLRYLSWFDGMDYVFAVDSDMLLVGELDERILGERVGVLSAWPYGLPAEKFNYDVRKTLSGQPFSSAFLTPERGGCYFAGGVFGGTLASFGEILRETTALSVDDLTRQPPRIALWHDESYINAVFAVHPPTVILGPHYVYSEPPADDWLFSAENPARDIWVYLERQGIQPKLLNLGVRKHAMSAVEDFQPASATLPGVMSLSGRPEFFQVAASKRDLAARVTFIVKAFERPSCLTRLLESIIAEYPGNPVVVLDDSREPVLSGPVLTLLKEQLPGLRYMRTDHDVGLAAGRNTLVDAVDTPYVLLLDDDFVLNDRSHIERLLDTLEWGRFDLVGGCIDSAYSYTLLHTPGQLEVRMDLPCEGWVRRPPEYDTPEMSCWEVDMINNFFLARTEFLRKVRWDPRLKLGEHEDFYLRVQQQKGRVGLCRGATAVNDNSCDASPLYKAKRGRVFDYWITFFQKHGLTEMRTAAGRYILHCNDTASASPDDPVGDTAQVSGGQDCRMEVQQASIWFNT